MGIENVADAMVVIHELTTERDASRAEVERLRTAIIDGMKSCTYCRQIDAGSQNHHCPHHQPLTAALKEARDE